MTKHVSHTRTLEKTLSSANHDQTTATIRAANRLVVHLAAEVIFTNATLGDETGEAGSLTLAVPGESLPFHIQLKWPKGDYYEMPAWTCTSSEEPVHLAASIGP